MFKKIIFLCLVAVGLNAHSLWVDSFESFAHKPGHTTVVLGWGHALPIDDMLNSPNGSILVEKFCIVSPDGEKTKLEIPSAKKQKASIENANFYVFKANLGTQKIAFKKDSTKGTYAIKAESKPTFYTKFIDTKGKTRLKLLPKDEVKNIKKTLMSVRYQAFASTYVTLGKWQEPKATNEGLEIIPLSDLSNVKVGDLVKFKILFYGKALNTTAKSMDYITAHSNTFGQNDGFKLFSYIMNGVGQFRVQSSGKWIVTVNHKNQVTKDGELKKFYKKAEQVFHGATLTFDVK